MYYVYILENISSRKLYIGYTHDLKRRVHQHNSNYSISTKNRGLWKLIFYEAYQNKYDALRREKYFKSGKGRRVIYRMLREYFTY